MPRQHPRSLFVLFFLATAWVVPALAAGELPAALRVDGRWHLQGQGELRWLGLGIYDASLWVRDGKWSPGGVFALEIRYHRSISAAQLVATSMDEMRRQGHDESRLQRWREVLDKALPSVAADDTIVGVHLPRVGLAFWHRGRPVAEIPDPALARAFFDIWLGPQSSNAGLRARLLGMATGD